MFKIGVMTDSFRTDTKTAIETAARLGADGFQMYATSGENAPENLTVQKRRALLKSAKSNGLVISAVCGDLGHGFGDREKNPLLIEKSKQILRLAKDLECDIVTTHIGVVPSDSNHERYKIMQEACYELSRFADEMNSHFAIETGPEPAQVLRNFLDALSSHGVAVNLDPANLVMVIGENPVDSVHILSDYIVHTHAKDGIMLKKSNPEAVYGIIEHETFAEESPDFMEVPLGEGKVDFTSYLNALKEVGYQGFLTIERECGNNPLYDITKAVAFLKDLIGKDEYQ